jgi:hypothetical protein
LNIPTKIDFIESEVFFVLNQTVAKNSSGIKGKLDFKIIDLIDELSRETGEILLFKESSMRVMMKERLGRLKDIIQDELFEDLSLAFHLIDEKLKKEPLLMQLAHRDFVPWNMKEDDKGKIFLFDWEYAEIQYLPMYDLFHFQLMPLVLRRKVKRKDIYNCIREIQKIKNPISTRLFYKPKVQMLAYLLDTSLFYLDSKDGECSPKSILYNGYLDMIRVMCKEEAGVIS